MVDTGGDEGALLPDGAHDALVVDTATAGDGAVSIELTVVSGERKGEMISVVAHGLTGSPLDLLGIPATITVSHGIPSVRFEP